MHPRSSSSARSMASTWPLMRRTRFSSFCFSRIVWLTVSPKYGRGLYYPQWDKGEYVWVERNLVSRLSCCQRASEVRAP